MRRIICFILIIYTLNACTRSYTPKPKGYIRIELPVPKYNFFDIKERPYAFNVSQLAVVELPNVENENDWFNINYTNLDVKIYCSYKRITPQSFGTCDKECRELVKRTVENADVITEKAYEDSINHIYGTVFQIEGKTATPIQFMVTDSVSNFLRGALYFQYKPNPDSIAPVVGYIKNDIVEMIQTLHWKK